ncbi:MAG TPA: serine hydrolase [Candidatus Didemnitutus sp.]|nr:serine hydrolase [Candidatus Didemnitutus sp.]
MKLFRFPVLLLGLSLLVRAAEDPSLKLPRSTPEAQGVSANAILGFVNAAEEKIDALHSFMLVRHGQVVAEGWWTPYAASEPHTLFSLSKSFTSTAVGLAVAEGKLSIDDPVLKFFPDQAPAMKGKNLEAMRVRDLLAMSTGHRDETIKDFPFQSQEDLVKVFLSLPVDDKPGTHFVYNTAGTFMLSAIVQKVTGQTVLDYLRPRLFEPLGIDQPIWETSAQGISMGGFGLNARTEDIARFGQLYLQEGVWQNKQLVPADWVNLATSRHVSNGSNPASDWEQGYGFQFWRCRHGVYRGDGAFGQFCLVMPEYDAVVAITSGTHDLQGVLNLVWEHLLPALQKTALAADADADQKLAAKLASLTLRPQMGPASSASAGKFAGQRFIFPANAIELQSITLDGTAPDGTTSWTVKIAGIDQKIAAAPGSWRKGMLTSGATLGPYAASGAWTSDDMYTMKYCRYRTPFVTTFRLKFAEGNLLFDADDNVGFPGGRAPQLIGKPE